MLIEDDADVSDAIASVLEDCGYSVRVAPNGDEALAELRASDSLPDLILLDLMMPVMDGWQFREAQKRDASLAAIPVIVLSADADIEVAARQLGCEGWLPKPIKLRILRDAVRSRVRDR
jgi:CheY-like chemotaxis protein